jgi:hypothetical protein
MPLSAGLRRAALGFSMMALMLLIAHALLT